MVGNKSMPSPLIRILVRFAMKMIKRSMSSLWGHCFLLSPGISI